MALFSEWMQRCAKKLLDNAGIVRDAIYIINYEPVPELPFSREHSTR